VLFCPISRCGATQRLEAARKVKSEAYYQKKKAGAALRAKAAAEVDA